MNAPAARARGLIAEDEPLLAQALHAQLAQAWPELEILPHATDGYAALEELEARRPDVAFLDIRMPGLTGLEVARVVLEDWPEGTPAPLLVFVTAYDAHAVEAFELAAADYLLKPVTADRLRACVERLRGRLHAREGIDLAALAQRLSPLLAPAAAAQAPLRYLQAGTPQGVRMLRTDTLYYLRAADKYVIACGDEGEALLRTSLGALEAQLDPARFLRIHRNTIVNLDYVTQAERDARGQVRLHLRGSPETLVVSRLHQERFKAM
ncbi:response regulator transcription factor [Verticiella sediminum]|uniref:Response regulator transcription factor n=1 Tax=Verticiella sediminum TaxID=1247510 RepID=A0A556AMM8_9BURK|nr:LytTR family DNA-binding domain-containing protein [Verticiella sediminum]TSH94138.1 response regulator transcription factor [Verticiella sediminum]